MPCVWKCTRPFHAHVLQLSMPHLQRGPRGYKWEHSLHPMVRRALSVWLSFLIIFHLTELWSNKFNCFCDGLQHHGALHA